MHAICQYRVGILVPSSNTKLEPAIQSILEHINAKNSRSTYIYAHCTRIRVTQVSLEESSAAQFEIENMLQAASLFVDAGVDAIAWAGTSAGWLGTENDRALCTAITERFHIPATTTTLALLEYMHTYTQQKLLLVTPFVQGINTAIRTTFAKEGIEVVDDRCLSITDNITIGGLTDGHIQRMVKDVTKCNPEIEALAVFCTNLYVAPEVGCEWEGSFALIDSIVVTVWELLRMIGTNIPGKSETDLQRLMVHHFEGNMFVSQKKENDSDHDG